MAIAMTSGIGQNLKMTRKGQLLATTFGKSKTRTSNTIQDGKWSQREQTSTLQLASVGFAHWKNFLSCSNLVEHPLIKDLNSLLTVGITENFCFAPHQREERESLPPTDENKICSTFTLNTYLFYLLLFTKNVSFQQSTYNLYLCFVPICSSTFV